ncbi:MAG: hypothetical protein RL708_2709 [Bacteroidota bacterium]|jgi:uncharacterized protein YqeY
MIKKSIQLIAVLSLLMVQVFAQPKVIQKEKVTFTVHLRNGDVISGNSNIRTMIVSTSYGTLALPVSNINSIKIGIINPEIDKESILRMIDKLNSLKPEVQKNGFESLVQQEPGAIYVIKEYLKSDNNTASINPDYSIEAALQQLISNYGIDDKAPMDDVIKYDDYYSAEGTCNFTGNIQIETAFGVLEIPRKSIVQIDITTETPESGYTKNFIIQANKNISGNADGGFLNTGITLKAGESFSISANGKVTIASLSNNSYTPDGGINGAPAPNDGGTNSPTYGNVVFKIGESGQTIKAGAGYRGKAANGGILYLAIYETVFNPANTGSYKVKVKKQ